MARRPDKRPKRLTPLEALIMDAVWDLSPVTAREVLEHVTPTKPMAYNTVLTVMRILRDKGFLASQRNGRADVYRPLVTREQMGRRSIRDVVERFFAGSPKALLSHLLATESFDADEIREIRREINGKLRNGNGKEATK
ncbi:MAG: BlaI/MecI/CopY family transcriptional regulator [Planctomycetota bacterium]|jgi:predicted transcriptional regulator